MEMEEHLSDVPRTSKGRPRMMFTVRLGLAQKLTVNFGQEELSILNILWTSSNEGTKQGQWSCHQQRQMVKIGRNGYILGS